MVNQGSKNTNSEKNITLDQIQIIPNYQGIADLPRRKKKGKFDTFNFASIAKSFSY